MSGQLHASAALPPGKDPSSITHWIGGWMETRAGLDTVSKGKIPSTRQNSNSDHPIVRP